MYARPFINSLDFAGNGRRISGEMHVSELPRMLDMLENPQGILSYAVQGGVNELGTHFLDVNVSGQCRLRCQRCLNGMNYPVRLDTRLLFRNQATMDALNDNVASVEEGEFDSILADAHLDVLNLLEEEILLSLPIAPKHEWGTCRAAGGENSSEAPHPFAVLTKLKSN